ncbi:hypothetical protein [Cellulomonas sp. PhB143]|uniref:AMIN-like domain-containing (lipo)protein n=1 Tax=Cellulomonas sp. PhB143 TaxID=2485186 RepID=UPI000F461353|nr:hypothetical protein [Cellulomonas sp. PhB143]ROS73557.1 hypothetical protein EDF32_2409 [Cellulomonas sp. PhB143]
MGTGRDGLLPAGRGRAAGVAALVLASALLLAGCTGDEGDGPAAGPATPTGAASDGSTAGTGSGTGSGTSSKDPAAPATTPGSGATQGGSDGGSDGGSGGDTDDDAPGAEAPSPDTPSDAPASEVPFPGDTKADTHDASADAALTVTDVRVGAHDGYDRVVFELDGAGTPGWHVAYTDDPREEGSGDAVHLDGDAALEVFLTGTGYPQDTRVPEYSGPNPVRTAATDEIEEVVYGGVFEGRTSAFLGVDEKAPFRVYALEDPARVVVDVRAG